MASFCIDSTVNVKNEKSEMWFSHSSWYAMHSWLDFDQMYLYQLIDCYTNMPNQNYRVDSTPVVP